MTMLINIILKMLSIAMHMQMHITCNNKTMLSYTTNWFGKDSIIMTNVNRYTAIGT